MPFIVLKLCNKCFLNLFHIPCTSNCKTYQLSVKKKIAFTNENVTDRINKIDLIKFLIFKYTRMFQP